MDLSDPTHRVLISSPVSLSQKARKANPRIEQKKTGVFAVLELTEQKS